MEIHRDAYPILQEEPAGELFGQFFSRVGEVYRIFRHQDSGCISYGIRSGDRKWFVKYGEDPQSVAGLQRARKINSTVRHDALPPLRRTLQIPDGIVLIYDWVPGEVLYEPSCFRGSRGRDHPERPPKRFRSLPTHKIVAALSVIYAVHRALAEYGYIAVDFYDGSMIYDFDSSTVYLCDLDEYRTGPFYLADERNPGSRRFMAPEEWKRGAHIDQVTNVYSLGRAAVIFLGEGELISATWRGNKALHKVVDRATQVRREDRYSSVAEFVDHWQKAVQQGGF